MTSDGAGGFRDDRSGGGVSGRANDHCKTSGDMLAPRCPYMVLQNAAWCSRTRPCHGRRPRGWVPTAPGDVSVVGSGLDGEHRTGGVEQDALGIGPQYQLADRSASAQANHDEVCVDLVGHLDQVL